MTYKYYLNLNVVVSVFIQLGIKLTLCIHIQ